LAPRPAAVAWLRFVGGLSVEQVATCLGVSERTVKSDWAFARAWLHRELMSEGLRPRSARSEREHDER
jgi:DNA-directed RNA polymerase specialized sigma24 family protein